MSLLDEGAFGNPDDFLHKYGADTPTLEQIRALQVGVLVCVASCARSSQPLWRM